MIRVEAVQALRFDQKLFCPPDQFSIGSHFIKIGTLAIAFAGDPATGRTQQCAV